MRAEARVGLGVRRELRHAITREGRHVLIGAEGDVPFWTKLRAKHNLKRWNEGKRTWLL